MPLGFINEIPDTCNLLIVSHSPVLNFWLKLEKKHKIKKLHAQTLDQLQQ